MGKKTLLILGVLFLNFLSKPAYTQDSIRIQSNVDGKVDYQLDLADPKSHVFILYGDGYFGTQKRPIHKFPSDSIGYTTEAYIVKPYKPNKPPKKLVSTDSTGTGSTHTNTPIKMTGNVDILTSWATASGHENYYIIAFQNSDDTSTVDGCIELYFKESELDIKPLKIREYNNWVTNRSLDTISTNSFDRKITWQFSGLAHQETHYIYVPGTVNLKVGQNLKIETKYKVNCQGSGSSSTGSGAGSNGFMVRRYPHDPNFKIVDQECLDVNTPFQSFEYTIGFFNDGDYFAQDVFVKDTISQDLDLNSFQFSGTEFHYPDIFFNDREVNFEFININLPGTEQEHPMSYSYEDASTFFKFTICNQTPVYPDMCIENRAEIIFDNQPAFITNTASVCEQEECLTATHCGTHRNNFQEEQSDLAKQDPAFEIYPNPFTDRINVSFNLEEEDTKFTLELVDYSGKPIRQLAQSRGTFQNFEKQYYLDNLPKGIYMIVLRTDQNIYTQKIIKQ